MKRLCLILLAPCLALAADRTILLVDDHDILFRAGTQRVLEKPVRHVLNPLITEDKPWEMAIAWTSVHRDKATGKYQLWYQAYAGKRAQLKTHECVVCYAESVDGISFTRPNLGLFDFNGEKATNIVLIGSGVYGDRYCNSVIVDAKEPDAAKRYKMLYYDWAKVANGEVVAGLHIANANATGGAVWCEILDEAGFRVPGFDKANGLPLKKDTTRYRVAWKEKKLSDLPPGKYHLRLHLQKATAYAVTLH